MKNKVVKLILMTALALIISSAFIAGCALSSYDWFVKTIKNNYYYPVDVQEFEGTDLKQLAEKYLDRYSAYYTADEYQELIKSNAGSKSGLGISYSFVEGRGVYISSVTGNSPAYICGLRTGEWLESGSFGGEEIEFNSSNDFAKLVNSAGDGEKIILNSADGENVYEVAKAEYVASYTCLATNDNAWVFVNSMDGGLAIDTEYSEIRQYLPDGTAYLRLNQFYGTAADEFNLLIKKFNSINCTSLILDLRSNGGGYVSVMQNIAYAFSGNTKTVAMYSRDKDGSEQKYYCTKVNANANTIPSGTNVYVLANSGTASASEALIGALVCYGVLDYENIFLSDYSDEYMNWLSATGQEMKTAQSYGKGIMQTTILNRNTGEALKLTTAQIFWPDKTTSIHDRGVTLADGCTAVAAEWQHTKTDEELRSVVQMIQARV